jgi:hypothetical protein
MPERITTSPNDDRTGRTIHKLTVKPTAAARKTIGVQGYPHARYGRISSGSVRRRRSKAIAFKARKIQTAKTNSEYNSS